MWNTFTDFLWKRIIALMIKQSFSFSMVVIRKRWHLEDNVFFLSELNWLTFNRQEIWVIKEFKRLKILRKKKVRTRKINKWNPTRIQGPSSKTTKRASCSGEENKNQIIFWCSKQVWKIQRMEGESIVSEDSSIGWSSKWRPVVKKIMSQSRIQKRRESHNQNQNDSNQLQQKQIRKRKLQQNKK